MVDIANPEPGYWAIRLVGNGPEVAARIFWTACPDCGAQLEPGSLANVAERGAALAGEIDGRPVDPLDIWTRRRRPIDEPTYRWLLADRAWARDFARHLPEARPFEAVTDEKRRKMGAIFP